MKQLRDIGPMTSSEIGAALKMADTTLWCAMQSLRHDKPKQVYISDWEYQEDGKQGAMSPVYKLGTAPDKKKPPARNAEKDKRYRQRNAALIRVRDQARKSGTINPYLQLLAPCRSAPKKQQSAKA